MGYVYILLTKTGKLYVGSTNDLKRRIEEHFKGIGCRFTMMNPPVSVVYVEECNNPRRREIQLKKLSRKDKIELIRKYKDRTEQILRRFDLIL